MLSFIVVSCGSQKETTSNVGIQNLTAKFNILYNANLLLEEIEADFESSHLDDYNQILPVFKEPGSHLSEKQVQLLDSVIGKAKKIIEDKSASNYVDDAYFLIATAQYNKANFFEAAEYFGYITRTYPGNRDLARKSLIMKARAEVQLGNLTEARMTLNAAARASQADEKPLADMMATSAQLHILGGYHEGAIEDLHKALQSKAEKKNKMRWRFILAQLQFEQGTLEQAFNNFQVVSRSNEAYDISFNASLNSLIIRNRLNGGKEDFRAQLQGLLKDEKNLDFRDQIFFRIAELHKGNNQLKEALDHYNLAILASTYNRTQKGLAYLRIADLYFNAANYTTAKLYLDSTLQTLPPSHPDYERTRTKNDNLDLLANRLQTIAREERRQALAKLPPDERDAARDESDPSPEGLDPVLLSDNTEATPANNPGSNDRFYFNNDAALAQGLSNFRKIWGNRPLEDHWRRSEKTPVAGIPTTANEVSRAQQAPLNDRQDALQQKEEDLPLTPEMLMESNKRIINALYDIAVFYRDELRDPKQAVSTFEDLLTRFPDTDYSSAIYYSLYQLYLPADLAKADYYKSIILSRYPETNFAKAILDPNYVNLADKRDAKLNEVYNEVYDLYIKGNYSSVIERVKEVEKQFGINKLSPQFAYLNALSVGRTQMLPPFEEALQAIVRNYPDDQFVSPLVQQHLRFIDLNRADFNSRTVALMDGDGTENEFENEAEPAYNAGGQVTAPAAAKNETPVILEQAPGHAAPPVAVTAETEPALFSLPDSAEYYFVVNVQSAVVNLSSSRFGIGQFNRTNLQGQPIKHQLMPVNNENQLILVGPFNDKVSAKGYERRIYPLLKEIMKIPDGKYNTFVITKDGLDKLKDSTLINSYHDFYKNSK